MAPSPPPGVGVVTGLLGAKIFGIGTAASGARDSPGPTLILAGGPFFFDLAEISITNGLRGIQKVDFQSVQYPMP